MYNGDKWNRNVWRNRPFTYVRQLTKSVVLIIVVAAIIIGVLKWL